MESAYKRMILLPEAEYVQLKQINPTAPLSTQWSPVPELHNERDQKLYAYNLAKQRESIAQANLESSTTTASATNPASRNNFESEIDLFPTTFRSRAKRLMSLLEKNQPQEIDWMDNGEVIFGRHGSPLHGTNLVDLLFHATSTRRRKNFIPQGWSDFLEALKRMNVPVSILNKPSTEEWQHGIDPVTPQQIKTPTRHSTPLSRKTVKRLKQSATFSTPHLRKSWIRI